MKTYAHPRDTGCLAWREAWVSFPQGPFYLQISVFTPSPTPRMAWCIFHCLLSLTVTNSCDLVAPSIRMPEW